MIKNQDNPEDLFIKNDEKISKRKWLLKALDSLNHRERKIINSRHICETPLTLKVIGKELNISKERVRKIEASAINKLKLRIKNLVLEKENKVKIKKFMQLL